MSVFEQVLSGVQITLQPYNLFYCFVGVLIGTLTGVLPGIGPIGAISLLLPVTFYIPPVTAIIMLAGIYYGSMYGGSTTSILVNIPGETASIVTCLDGYQMARKGRAGPALGMAAFASFIAGTLSVVGLMFLADLLAGFALDFGPSEYFSLECLGLLTVVFVGAGSKVKAMISGTIGLFLSTVGIDVVSGSSRFTMGVINLMAGIGIVPLAMGLFGVSEILMNIGTLADQEIFSRKIGSLLPTRTDWRAAKGAILRGTVLGFLIGAVPGIGPVTASFFSYAVEKKVSKYPQKFGTGVIEGVAGPEAANNSATGGGLVPLFSLGIPTNAPMALLFGALLIHGVQPGPLMVSQHPEIFWGLVASMYIGNVMLVILNLPLIAMWVQILKIPYRTLFPFLLLFALLGTFAADNRALDMFIMILFGILGYLFRRFGYEGAPLILGYVLGSLMEKSLRQALMLADGDYTVIFTRPISAGLWAVIVLIAFISVIHAQKKAKKQVLARL